MSVFKNYSAYYDLLYQDKNYEQEVEYVENLAKKFTNKPESILELGCGTGKHAQILAEKGYEICGVDFSESMLNIARERSSERAIFVQGNVQNIEIGKRFDLIISLFHVASYQATNEELQNYFLTASKHLKQEGLFIFDSWYGPAVLSERPEKRNKTIENDLLKISRTATPVLFLDKNIVDVHYDLIIEDKTAKKTEKINELHKMRYLFIPEIEIFLKNAGLKLIHCEEWLTGGELGVNTWNSCFVAGNLL